MQAQYWHDPLHTDKYVEKSRFIAEINNEKAEKNASYAVNLALLENFVMILHESDSMVEPRHGRMNYKDTKKPYMSAFLSADLLTDFAAFCLTDFIDWRYIHSWFIFSTQLVNCCPHGRRNYTLLVAPLLYLLSDLLPPSQCTVHIYRQCVTVGGGGGVEMYCGPYSAGVLHSSWIQETLAKRGSEEWSQLSILKRVS